MSNQNEPERRPLDPPVATLGERMAAQKPVEQPAQTRNPISTLDTAILWLATGDYDVEFYDGAITVFAPCANQYVTRTRKTDEDARGTLMMACRELWEMLNAGQPEGSE